MTASAVDTLRVKRLSPQSVVPTRAHDTDAGLDLASIEDVTIQPGGRALVGTGIAVAVPEGWAGLVCPRSGLAARHGISVVNGPGVIDAGYRGEVRVVLLNTDLEEPFAVAAGDRIAQLLLVPVSLAGVEVVDDLGSADRSTAGFGSSGGFSGGA